jgi:glutaredoxin
MADFIQVDGRDIGDIKIFTLSTCGWCKKTKTFFNDKGIRYAYIDMDKLDGAETDAVRQQQLKFNRFGSYPTIVINDSECIVGYDEDALNALVGNSHG